MENSHVIEPNWNTHCLKERWIFYKKITNSNLIDAETDEIPEILSTEASVYELDVIDT
jgi:hypothetical protein